MATNSQAPAQAPGSLSGMLLRFVSCGLLSLACGAAWRIWGAPARIGVGSALAGVSWLLAGFIAGGLLWYRADMRRRQRSPEAVSDSRVFFSFFVFALVPLLVLAFVVLIWLVALFVSR